MLLTKQISYYSSRFGDIIPFLFYKRATAKDCGHRTLSRGRVRVHGYNFHLKISKDPELCLKCREKITILCGRCEKLILPGRKVVLFVPKEGRLAHHATPHHENPDYFIGCTRPGCTRPGDIQGYHWLADKGEDGELIANASRTLPARTRAA